MKTTLALLTLALLTLPVGATAQTTQGTSRPSLMGDRGPPHPQHCDLDAVILEGQDLLVGSATMILEDAEDLVPMATVPTGSSGRIAILLRHAGQEAPFDVAIALPGVAGLAWTSRNVARITYDPASMTHADVSLPFTSTLSPGELAVIDLTMLAFGTEGQGRLAIQGAPPETLWGQPALLAALGAASGVAATLVVLRPARRPVPEPAGA